jgi:hypothetical protein
MQALMLAMGLPGGFNSTKGKKVDDPKCNLSGAKVVKQRKYKQYMNLEWKKNNTQQQNSRGKGGGPRQFKKKRSQSDRNGGI